MEINEALKRRISEIKEIDDKKLIEERFKELWMLFNRIDKECLSENIVSEVKELRAKIEIQTIKHKLKESEGKERKIKKVDNFNELCSLMKYQQFDEAIKKFNERKI